MAKPLALEVKKKDVLAKLGIRVDGAVWTMPMYMDGEYLTIDMSTIPGAWSRHVSNYLLATLEGTTKRGTQSTAVIRERFYMLRRFLVVCQDEGASCPEEIDTALVIQWYRNCAKSRFGKHQSACARSAHVSTVAEFIADHLRVSNEVRVLCAAIRARSLRSKRLQLRRNGWREGVSEASMLRYLRDALAVINNDAEKVIQFCAESARVRALQPSKDTTTKQYVRAMRRQRIKSPISAALRNLDSASSVSEPKLRRVVCGAAILVISLLSVMRTSELRRLRVGCVEEWVEDGERIFVVRGHLSKSGRSHTWVVGRDVKKAIEVLEELGREMRSQNASEYLMLGRLVSGSASYVGGTKVSDAVATGHQLLLTLRNFVSASDPTDTVTARKITFRATRRFLARFIARRDRTSLGALADQYGHLDARVTDTYYVGSDPDLARILEEEVAQEVAIAMDDLVHSESVYSNLPQCELDAVRERMEGVLARASTQVDALRMMGGGTVLGACDWGYCFYREKRSKCDGGPGGPNDANRTPSVCVGCLNFSATEEHADWWSRRVSDLEAFLRLRSIPLQSRLLAKSRLADALRVVKAIAGEK
ncbi:phage integrase family protein [Stenotrophomonas maltophilia]|uniref:phage integrase family protein n=1 Tax=Stenotrophomonas maltophilia TaxID=40324 RepID=UPI0011107505|nr:phage integrase family protein [Stenotrophomonas maltophilia]TIL14089.1 hypothetical protein E4419_13020 [Stenotrophomonas maltophilia]